MSYRGPHDRVPLVSGQPGQTRACDNYVDNAARYDMNVALTLTAIATSRQQTRALNTFRRNSLVDRRERARRSAFVLLPAAVRMVPRVQGG